MTDVTDTPAAFGHAARAARHAELLPRLRALEAIRKSDRSAVQDAEIDALRKEAWQLEQASWRYGETIPSAISERQYWPLDEERRLHA
jgi:hypothetical protein